MVTRIGKVVPGSGWPLSTARLKPYRRSEKALVSVPAKRDVQRVSTRKITTITEARCRHSLSLLTAEAST